jgi:hypothetical protein
LLAGGRSNTAVLLIETQVDRHHPAHVAREEEHDAAQQTEEGGEHDDANILAVSSLHGVVRCQLLVVSGQWEVGSEK